MGQSFAIFRAQRLQRNKMQKPATVAMRPSEIIGSRIFEPTDVVARASAPAAVASGRRSTGCLARTPARTPALRAGGPRHNS
jgi:hypothetical protein